MRDFLRAVGCLLVACVPGEIILSFGGDFRASSHDDAYTHLVIWFFIYCWMVVFAAPFWLFTFLPLYLAVPAKSFFWRWSVAPTIGLLIGSVGSLIVFGKQDFYYPLDLFFPAAIGFTVFLLGAIFKRRSSAISQT
jgi:hypothetical protein